MPLLTARPKVEITREMIPSVNRLSKKGTIAVIPETATLEYLVVAIYIVLINMSVDLTCCSVSVSCVGTDRLYGALFKPKLKLPATLYSAQLLGTWYDCDCSQNKNEPT